MSYRASLTDPDHQQIARNFQYLAWRRLSVFAKFLWVAKSESVPTVTLFQPALCVPDRSLPLRRALSNLAFKRREIAVPMSTSNLYVTTLCTTLYPRLLRRGMKIVRRKCLG